MRRLENQATRGAFLLGLSIGEKLKVAQTFTGTLLDATHDAEVIGVHADHADVQVFIEGIAGGHIVALYFVDGESRIDNVNGETCWFEVAVEQPEHEEPKSEAEVIDDMTSAATFNGAPSVEREIRYNGTPGGRASGHGVSGGTGTTAAAVVEKAPEPVVIVPQGPRPAEWLLAQAALIETEAKHYVKYSPPHTSLMQAAQHLRSAVGHVLAGGCEVKRGATPEPF